MSCVNNFPYFPLVVKLLLLTTLMNGLVFEVGCLNFNYSTFPESTRSNLTFAGRSNLNLDAIQVTPDNRNASLSNRSGRVCYKEKFKLWRKQNTTASFNSTFVLNITPTTPRGGEGVAFILTKDCSIPDDSQGKWLGIVNASTNGSSHNNIVAVEFDTKKSYVEDVDDNHVGVDINSIYSIKQASLGVHGVNISSATDVQVSIQYDGLSKIMNIYASMNSTNATKEYFMKDPILSIPLNLSDHLPEDVYVGFSASTGDQNAQLNCVKSWDFTSTNINEDSVNLWVRIAVPAIVIVVILIVIACYIYKRIKTKKEQVVNQENNDPEIELEIQSSATAPQKFQLKELQSATDNFNFNKKLGQGGFGTVYKGVLNNKEVAVKRTSKNSRQGKQEFIAEVTTIGSLHHKNLVKLVGWCYESNELLLVYELMPNGSLDKLIFVQGRPSHIFLSWERRHGIICGVARALDYLHNGCEKRVLHRDIKSSNIMLDSEFNARLGDFGLARTICLSGKDHHSTKEIAGTPGYMSPESFLTGRATVETDVYAFGVLLLEVACGRRPGNQTEDNTSIKGIVEWVWELHSREKIVDAMDLRLNGELIEMEQVECVLLLGLACCNPNPYERPSMKTVLQILTGEAEAPFVPTERPPFMWPANLPSHNVDLDSSLCGGQITPFSELIAR